MRITSAGALIKEDQARSEGVWEDMQALSQTLPSWCMREGAKTGARPVVL